MRLLPLALLLVATALPASAQRSIQPRFGFGFDALVTPPGQDLLPEGLGIGLRGRVSVPVNRDLSVAASVGAAGFVFRGRDDATYVYTPQLSAILTLPRRGGSARYLLGGFGGVIPSSGGEGGPSIHIGAGWAFPLNETSLYVEVNPALVIGERETTVTVPVRVGVIF